MTTIISREFFFSSFHLNRFLFIDRDSNTTRMSFSSRYLRKKIFIH